MDKKVTQEDILHAEILEEAKETILKDFENKRLNKPADPTLTKMYKEQAKAMSKREDAVSYASIKEFYEAFTQFVKRANDKYGATGIPTVVKGAKLAEVEYAERVIGDAIEKGEKIPREDKTVSKIFSIMGEGLVVELAIQRWFDREVKKYRESKLEYMDNNKFTV